MMSESNSNHILAFCYDCGCLQLRDVTDQLHELFIKRSINPDMCGICNCSILCDNTTKLEPYDESSLGEDEMCDQDEAEETIISDLSHIVKTEPDSHVKPEFSDDVDADDEDDDGGGFDYDDSNNGSTDDVNIKSDPYVESPPADVSASCSSNVTTNLTDTSTKISSPAAPTKKSRQKRVNTTSKVGRKPSKRSKGNNEQSKTSKGNKEQSKRSKGNKEQSKRSKGNKEQPEKSKDKNGAVDTGTTVPQETRVTRLSSGVIKAANYQSIYEGNNDDFDDSYDEEAEEMTVDDERSSDDDFDPCDSDDPKNFDVTPYLVKNDESEPSGSKSRAVIVPGVQVLAPALQQFVTEGESTSNDRFQCRLCSHAFKFIPQMKTHLVACHAEEVGEIGDPFVCVECGKAYSLWSSFRTHQSSHLRGTVAYKCNHKKCNFTFRRSIELISHVQYHKGKRPCMCSTCGVGFKDDRALAVHKTIHSNTESYSCKYCARTFSHMYYLRTHEWKHMQDSKYKCDLCPYTCEKSITLKDHQFQEHEKVDESLQCKRCKVVYKKENALLAHVKANKCKPIETDLADFDLNEVTKNLNSKAVDLMGSVANINMPFQCKHCPMMRFRHVMAFLKHLKNIHSKLYPDVESVMKQPYKCSECGKLYPNRDRLSRHQENHAEGYPYKCDYPHCNRSFKLSGSFYFHKETAHQEPQFLCKHCGKRLTSKSHLKAHEDAVHLKIQPWLCSHCGKAFAKKSKLRGHVNRVHLKLKPCVCDTCGQAFADRSDLKSHMVKHTGEKPFKCNECSYTCARRDYLQKHKRTHTGEKPYSCELCGISFKYRIQLFTHKKNVHDLDGSKSQTPKSNVPSSSTMSASHATENDGANESESKTAAQFLHENFNV